MILFEQDWSRFPTAIADYQTQNQSFLRMVSLYRDMGVKNCLFPLALIQPELQGIDPYDPELPDETKVKIGLECRYNPWYYLREVTRIKPVSSNHMIPYKANRGNLALTWLFLCHIDVALIQPRQTGKSVSTDCISNWVMYIGAVNTVMNLITKNHVLRTKNVERLKAMRDLMPSYLIPMTSRDTDNQTELTCRSLGNSYLTAVAQTSESAANNLGRGLTSPIFHVDEGPFIRFIGVTLPAALAAGTAAREEAELYNRPYGNIFTTTAGRLDDRDGRYMYDMIHGGSVWNEIFLDCQDRHQLKELIGKNCSGRKVIVNATFSHRQLGYTDEWLYNSIAETNATEEEANRDFFNIWTSGSQRSPLSIELNERIRNSEMDPKHHDITPSGYIIRWYIPENQLEYQIKHHQWALGIDTSDAIGRDAIALIFSDLSDFSTVATVTLNETNLIKVALFISYLLVRFENTTLIIERKSSAQAIIDSLLIELPKNKIDPFRRIYNTIVDHHHERPREYAEIQLPMHRRGAGFYDRYKKTFGFNTTGSSRDVLYSAVLQNAAKEAGHVVRDRTLSSEIRGLVEKNGRIDHANSSHDDHVFAWLLNQWLLTHSRNLSFYGINTRQLLSNARYKEQSMTPEQEYHQFEQKQLRDEIDQIIEALSQQHDEYKVAQLETRLMSISQRIEVDDTDRVSIDQMIQEAKEAREMAQRKRQLEQRRHQPHYRQTF